MAKNKHRIITIDPSLTGFGFVVIGKGEKILKTGVVKTKPADKKLRVRKGDDTVRRVREISNALLHTIQKYEIALIVSEQPHGSQSAVSMKMVGLMLGLIENMSVCLNIPIEWYLEGECKKTLLGKRSAGKGEIIDKVKELYRVNWYNTKYKDEAIADAIAVYHHAKHYSQIIKYIQNG